MHRLVAHAARDQRVEFPPVLRRERVHVDVRHHRQQFVADRELWSEELAVELLALADEVVGALVAETESAGGWVFLRLEHDVAPRRARSVYRRQLCHGILPPVRG